MAIFEEYGAFKRHPLYIQQTTDWQYRFISKKIGFDISCKFHEIPKPFLSGKIRTIF